jgi:drug/metabolite transporter (DMT)-like permease
MNKAHHHSHLWPGVPLALGSAALFGATPPLSSMMIGSVNPFLLAGLLYFGAGIGLLIYRVIKGASQEARLTRKDWPWLALAIATGGIAGPVLLMMGLSLTTASTASLLLNLEGLATMAIAWLVYKENVDNKLLLGAAVILAGAVLLTWSGHGLQIDQGAMLVAAACLAWGMDNNFTRKISAADPVTIATIKGLVAGTVNITLAVFAQAQWPSFPIAASAGLVGFFGIGVSLVMFILALRHLGTARTGAYYSLAPFIGAVLSIAFLGETLSAKLLIAAASMAVGLWLHLSENHEHEHAHEPLEHDHLHSHDEHHQHKHDDIVTEPHSHWHQHTPMRHKHPHYPDLHHGHTHS